MSVWDFPSVTERIEKIQELLVPVRAFIEMHDFGESQRDALKKIDLQLDLMLFERRHEGRPYCKKCYVALKMGEND